MSNICALFRDACAERLEETFLQLPDGQSLTFGDMEQRVANLAGVLRKLGLAADDRVMAYIPKTPDNLALYLAVLQIGAIFVPLNTAYTARELGYFIEDAEPGLLVCSEDNYAEVSAVIQATECASTPLVRTLGGTTASDESLEGLLGKAETVHDIQGRLEDDLAALMYTSGTTGHPKGAMISHGNMISNAHVLLKAWALQPEDVLIHALPLFHVHGLFVAMHCALLTASRVLFYPRFDAQQIIAGLAEATIMMGVPTFYTRLLSNPDFESFHCQDMRLFISGSAPMTEQVHAAWIERTGHQILERYGMTELGMVTSNPCEGQRIPGTVGYALPGVEVRVADDRGVELPRGEIGTLEVRGPNVFRGYWRKPELTACEFQDDGYFITGDLASMDRDGRVSIVGRGRDLIISGGYNVYPGEIEMLLDELPGVLESAVIGIPHDDLGEAVCAVIVPESRDLTTSSAQAALAGKLARFKQPSHFYFVEELPRTAMGKVQKNLLRERYSGVSGDS